MERSCHGGRESKLPGGNTGVVWVDGGASGFVCGGLERAAYLLIYDKAGRVQEEHTMTGGPPVRLRQL